MTIGQPVEILRNFESLGDNCEFGLVQRHFGAEGLGLLRWGHVQVGVSGLIGALRRRFQGAGTNVSIQSLGNEYISRDDDYGIVFHTDKFIGSVDVDRLQKTESARIAYLARKLVEDIEHGGKILVYKSSSGITLEQVRNISSALKSINRAARLLWVVEAHGEHKAGTVTCLGNGLFCGFIDRFSPTADVLSYCSFQIWLDICRSTVEDTGGSSLSDWLADPLPPNLEAVVYRDLWPDLRSLNDEEVVHHYENYGMAEGRQANHLAELHDFVDLIPSGVDALEIGPFCKPLLRGPNVRYFDVLDTPQLRKRAAAGGLPEAGVPQIHYVSATGDLGIVAEKFDCVVSSHCIEHQPDLVAHLQKVSSLLREAGRYFLVIPDKRYCFDACIAESTIADVLDAHHTRRRTHTLRSVIEHRVLTTHSDWQRHWRGDNGIPEDQPRRLRAALLEYQTSGGAYIDVHAWYFTPKSISVIFNLLLEAGIIDLEIERLYPTRLGENEFRMVLRKT